MTVLGAEGPSAKQAFFHFEVEWHLTVRPQYAFPDETVGSYHASVANNRRAYNRSPGFDSGIVADNERPHKSGGWAYVCVLPNPYVFFYFSVIFSDLLVPRNTLLPLNFL